MTTANASNPIADRRLKIADCRSRGAAAVLAMMFLVVFGSLAAAMAIVSQGNLHSAESVMRVNRSLAGAETGMNLLIYRLEKAAQTVRTTDGLIIGGAGGNAQALWLEAAEALRDDFAGDFHNAAEPYIDPADNSVHIGPILMGSGEPTFEATLTPHPLDGENYADPYYDLGSYDGLIKEYAELAYNKPYNLLTAAEKIAARASWTPDERLVRVTVLAGDGPTGSRIYRSITMDFRIDKKIRFAILSGSRVMIGRNVMVEGALGSRFTETNLTHGHPVQIESDFRGLDPDTSGDGLDAQLAALTGTLITNDTDGDNRLNLEDPVEIDGLASPEALDLNGDRYIDDWDFFLGRFSSSNNAEGKPRVTSLDLSNAGVTAVQAAQLVELIDTFGDPSRPGYNDGIIDDYDRYAKIRGEVHIKADLDGWLNGAAGGAYQDFFQGPIFPGYEEAPLTFQSSQTDVFSFGPEDFDVSSFRAMANGDFANQSNAETATARDSTKPVTFTPAGDATREAVPYGSPHPYDYYERPVYENMVFTDVTIPKGTNALFKNCKFIGCTFIETETNNTDEEYLYAGMQESDGSQKHPTITATVGGDEVADTKTIANNLRFDGCEFEGAVVSDAPKGYTHTRNKIAFTGKTVFADMREPDQTPNLSQEERNLFIRSTILAPHYSLELGTFINPEDPTERVHLSGTIVAGLIDMRGQVEINGTILTTFEPKSNVSPVIGETSPQFNTTLGYFASEAGDLESEVPSSGLGVIQVRYDPTLPLPDGLDGPIEIAPMIGTYHEGGLQ